MPAHPESLLSVLVIDDDPTILAMIAAVCEMEGIVPFTASTEQSVVRMLANGVRPDGALMDLNMPGTTAIRLAQMLRADDPSLPITVMSATDPGNPELEKICAGYQARFMRKPLQDIDQIPEEVRTFQERRERLTQQRALTHFVTAA